MEVLVARAAAEAGYLPLSEYVAWACQFPDMEEDMTKPNKPCHPKPVPPKPGDGGVTTQGGGVPPQQPPPDPTQPDP